MRSKYLILIYGSRAGSAGNAPRRRTRDWRGAGHVVATGTARVEDRGQATKGATMGTMSRVSVGQGSAAGGVHGPRPASRRRTGHTADGRRGVWALVFEPLFHPRARNPRRWGAREPCCLRGAYGACAAPARLQPLHRSLGAARVAACSMCWQGRHAAGGGEPVHVTDYRAISRH